MWQSLIAALDTAQLRPARADTIITRELADRTGPYYVLKNAESRTYARLSAREFWLWQQMDGTRSVQELIVAYFLAHGTFALDLVVELIHQLSAKHMLRERPQFVFASINRTLEQRRLAQRLARPAQALLTREWSISNLDSLLTRLYSTVGWVLYTWPMQLLYFLSSVLGVLLVSRVLAGQRFALAGDAIGLNILMLWLAAVLPIAIHELGHALTVKHYGRDVDRGGVMLFYGAPAAFIDTSDIWMEDKRPRLAVTWAGPYSGFILGGCCMLVLALWPESALAPFLFQMGAMSYAISIVNLNPLLKLDGYYLLSDALEILRLRERSLAFVRHGLIAKLRRRERFSREELFFVVFGLLAMLWTVYVVVMSLIVWNTMVSDELSILLTGPGSADAVIKGLLTFLLGGSLLAWLGLLGYHAARRAYGVLHHRGYLSNPQWLGIVAGLGALTLTCGLTLVAPADWVYGVLGTAALVAALILAVVVARSLRGARVAVAGWALAGGTALLFPAQILLAQGWVGSAALIRALDIGSLALAGLALALGWQLLSGLAGSWRTMSVALLALSWTSLASTLIAGVESAALVRHTLAGLLLVAGLWHWHAFRPATFAIKRRSDLLHTASEQLQDAYANLVVHLLDTIRQAYGWGTTRRISAQFNRHADAYGWEIRFAEGQHVAEALPARLDISAVADLSETLILALTTLLDTATHLVGAQLTRHALTRSYDALVWEQRELLGEYVLSDIPIAAGLAAQDAQTQRDAFGLLMRAPLFASFTADEVRGIGAALRPVRFARGTTIIRQGEPGDQFYLLHRGRVAVSQRDTAGNEQMLHELVRGDYFGETALLTGAPRNATIRALTPVEALALRRADFDQLLRGGIQGQRKIEQTMLREGLLRRIPIFRDFDPTALRQLATQLEPVTLAAGAVVFRQGDVGDHFYIVERGQVAVGLRLPSGEEVEQGRLGPGEYFGEIALLMDAPRTATVMVTQPATLLSLQAAAFNALVRDSVDAQRMLQRTGSRRAMANSQRIRRSAADIPMTA